MVVQLLTSMVPKLPNLVVDIDQRISCTFVFVRRALALLTEHLRRATPISAPVHPLSLIGALHWLIFLATSYT